MPPRPWRLAFAAGRSLCTSSAPPSAPLPLRPFRVLGLQQVAIGGPSKPALRRLWVDLLGLTRVGEFTSARENVDEDILRAGRGDWAVEVDIMQPLDAAAAPRVHVPPLNHVGLWVDDLRAACEWLVTHGGLRLAPGGIRAGAGGHDVAFLHPKSAEGVLIELVQAPAALVAAFEKLK